MRSIEYSTKSRLTTKMRPRSLTVVHFRVYWSFLYGGFRAADASSATLAPGRTFSSMKTSLMRELITLAPTGTYDLDQSTTPDVVRISKLSSIFTHKSRAGGTQHKDPSTSRSPSCLGRVCLGSKREGYGILFQIPIFRHARSGESNHLAHFFRWNARPHSRHRCHVHRQCNDNHMHRLQLTLLLFTTPYLSMSPPSQ